MKVPLLDLKLQYESVKDELLPAIYAVLDVQEYCNGSAVREFERAFCEYHSCDAAVGVNSGTSAILCALMSLGLEPGDEVITTPFTFFATAGCISRTGAVPVFADIDPDTFNIDPASIERAITSQTKAILPVHLYGQISEMDEICALADKRGIAVIEDAAQAVGAKYKDRFAGTFGWAAAFSFYPTKNLSAIGEGGMITTQSSETAEQLEMTRNHGMDKQYNHVHVGGNFRMDSIQAAALSVKLKHLPAWNERRRSHAAKYNEILADCPQVKTPTEREYNFHVYHQYVIRAENRDGLRKFLNENDIASGVYYPLCLHQQKCFSPLGYKPGDFPNAEQAAKEVLALPISPELTDEQIIYTAEKIREFCND